MSWVSEVRTKSNIFPPTWDACYSFQPLLHLCIDTICSCCGVQQGDPLGPLGFALTTSCRAYQGGGPWSCLECMVPRRWDPSGFPRGPGCCDHKIEKDCPSVGLVLNRAKSLLFIPEEADASLSPLSLEIPITRCGFTLLDSPLAPFLL